MTGFTSALAKRKYLALGLIAGLVLVGVGLWAWRNIVMSPEMVMKALNRQHDKVLAMCPPPPPRVPESEEGRYPLHVDHWGANGPKVLLIHGGVQGRIGGGPLTFDRQRALANMGWSLDVVWRPGFGASPSRGPDDMVADARAIAELITPGTNIIAHSWGGTEGLLAAARHPDRVSSLVIIEPAIMPTIGGTSVLSDPAVMADLKERTIAQLKVQTPGDFARFFAAHMGNIGSDLKLGPELTPELATETGCNGLYAKMASNEEVLAAIDVVKKAHIPTLLITGGWSPSIDATGESVAHLIGGRHVIVKSPNHFVQYANPTEFNAVVSQFMKQAQPAR